MTDEINLADLGTALQVTVTESKRAVDISGATLLEIFLISPRGEIKTRTASLVNDGVDGKMQYTTVSGDIDEAGTWAYYGRITFSPTRIFRTINPQTFVVSS